MTTGTDRVICWDQCGQRVAAVFTAFPLVRNFAQVGCKPPAFCQSKQGSKHRACHQSIRISGRAGLVARQAPSTRKRSLFAVPSSATPTTPSVTQAMGFDMLDGDNERESETDRNKARWRETEEGVRKAAGLNGGIEEEGEEGEQDREGQLPEPDAEGRRMAESEEVILLSRSLRLGWTCWYKVSICLLVQRVRVPCFFCRCTL